MHGTCALKACRASLLDHLHRQLCQSHSHLPSVAGALAGGHPARPSRADRAFVLAIRVCVRWPGRVLGLRPRVACRLIVPLANSRSHERRSPHHYFHASYVSPPYWRNANHLRCGACAAQSRKNMWGEGTRYEFLPGPHVFFALQQRLPGAEGPPEGKERRPLPASPTHSYAPWRSGLS